MTEKIKIIENLDFPLYVKLAFYKMLGYQYKEIQYFKEMDKPEKTLDNYFQKYQSHGQLHALHPMFDNLTAVLAIKMQNIALSKKIIFIKNLNPDFFNHRIIASILEVPTKEIQDALNQAKETTKLERLTKELECHRADIEEIIQSEKFDYIKTFQIKALGLTNNHVAIAMRISTAEVRLHLQHYRKKENEAPAKTTKDYQREIEAILKTDKTDEEKIFKIRQLNPKVFTYNKIGEYFDRSKNYAINAYKRYLIQIESKSDKIKRFKKAKKSNIQKTREHEFTSATNSITKKSTTKTIHNLTMKQEREARRQDYLNYRTRGQELKKTA